MSVPASWIPDHAGRAVLTTKETAAFLSLSVATLRRLMDRDEIPAPLKLTTRRIAWRINDLGAWLDCREAGREWQDCKKANAA